LAAVLEEQQPVPQKLGEILPGDTLDVAIWKLMADFGEYSAADLAVFLADYDYNPVSISPKLSIFFKAGYVTRRAVEQLPKRPYFVYRLNDLPMPARWQKAAVNESEVQSNNENKEEEVKADLVSSAAPAVLANQPLFEVSMKIRGVDFTLGEVKDLYSELTASGFAVGVPAKKSLVQASYNIKGVDFTHEELNQLVGKIGDFGIDVSKAVEL
jgi:hypothetical protein